MNPFHGLDWASIGVVVANHLWQSTLFVGLCWVATLLLKRNSASIRHWIWLAASLKFLLPFSLMAGLGAYLGSIADVRLAQPEWPAMQSISQPFQVLTALAPVTTTPVVTPVKNSRFRPWFLAAAWLTGFAAVALWRVMRWRRLAAFIGNAHPLRDGREVEALQRVQLLQGATARAVLALSPSAIEPGVRGIVRPVLLLPAGISDHLDDEQLEAIVAHEVCHIRRRDNLAAVIHMIVETVFWFHPLVWSIGTRLVDERERACDEDVVRLGSDPQIYAGAILRVCEFYMATPVTIMSRATGSNLKLRIEDIMMQRTIHRVGSVGTALLAIAAFALVGAPIVLGVAQGTQRPVENRSVVQQAASAKPMASGQSQPPRPVTREQSPGTVPATGKPTINITATISSPLAQAVESDYAISPEDELEIVVWRQPELTRRVVVRPDGKIGVPLLNDLPAAGLTPMQLRDLIQRGLREFVSDPNVSVMVVAARKPQVTIQGAIARPGFYSLSPRLTVLQLIAQAGGMGEFAKRDQITVFRDNGGVVSRHVFNYPAFLTGADLNQNLVLKDGDIVIVP